jgi:hypothetical protein
VCRSGGRAWCVERERGGGRALESPGSQEPLIGAWAAPWNRRGRGSATLMLKHRERDRKLLCAARKESVSLPGMIHKREASNRSSK